MSRHRYLPGLHIQWPWSRLILSGAKIVETRSYALPAKYIGVELAIIETPGPRGSKDAGIKKARIVGTISFSTCFKYKSSLEWERDFPRHGVPSDDLQYQYKCDKSKWGWVVADVSPICEPVTPPKKRGIVFALNCRLKVKS